MKKISTLLLFTAFVSLKSNAQFFTSASLHNTVIPAFQSDDKFLTCTSYDVNGDGFLDLLLDGGFYYANSGGSLPTENAVLMLGDGLGNFNLQQYIPKQSTLHVISDLGDYNGDGYTDMLMYHYWSNGFYLYTGDGNGMLSFIATPLLLGTGTHGGEAKFVDFDNDGDLDIFSVSAGSAAINQFHTFTNNNSVFTKTSYQTDNIFGDTGRLYTFYKDFNGDNLIDAFVTRKINGYFDTASIFIQLANHTFQQTKFSYDQYTNMQYYQSINFADFNNDNILDVVAEKAATSTGLNYQLYYGNTATPGLYNLTTPSATQFVPFAMQYVNTPTGLNGNIAIADIDNNGKPDIVANHYNVMQYYESTFHFTYIQNIFESNVTVNQVLNNVLSSSSSNIDTFTADLNNDGFQDAITHLSNSNELKVFMNNTNLAVNQFSSDNVTIYPNPVKNTLNIQNYDNSTINEIKIVNQLCQMVYQSNQNNITTVDLSNYSSGIYFVTILKNNNQTITNKIIKE